MKFNKPVKGRATTGIIYQMAVDFLYISNCILLSKLAGLNLWIFNHNGYYFKVLFLFLLFICARLFLQLHNNNKRLIGIPDTGCFGMAAIFVYDVLAYFDLSKITITNSDSIIIVSMILAVLAPIILFTFNIKRWWVFE